MSENEKDGPQGKRDRGRPTKYRPEFVEQAKKLCLLLGATNANLADFFEVTESTVDNWIRDHDEFRNAIHWAKNIADSDVAAATYHRATGYSHPETKVLVVDGKIEKVEVVKHYAPDTGAAAFWLKNRQGWRDKVDLAGSGPGGSLPLIVTYEHEEPPEFDDEAEETEDASGLDSED